MSKTLNGLLLTAAALGPPVLGQTGSEARETAPPSAVEEIVASLEPAALRALADEILARSPELARLRRQAEIAEARAPQVRSLPDPMAALTAFLLTPETRTGPQQAQASLSQRFPWAGKLVAAEREALWMAASERAQVEVRALELVTEFRRLVWELATLDAEEEIVRGDRYTLERFEQLARARYAAGGGIGQPVVKIQAEITRVDQRLLDVAARRAALTAAVNALRDRPADAVVEVPDLPALPPGPDPGLTESHHRGPAATLLPSPDGDPEVSDTRRQADAEAEAPELDELRRWAVARRPELARERARIAAAEAAGERAGLERRPDVTVGLSYTLVGEREDAGGRAMPPEDNGDDIVGVTLGLNLPVRRSRIDAGIAEAVARRGAAEEALRGAAAAIERDLGDLVQRLRLTRQQRDLFDRVLLLQAEEALHSAEAAYTAGTLRALDLLDAERILFQVRLGAARARADHLIARARLEGAVGGGLDTQGATP
jgi:outer membrane protein TolC